METMLSVMVWLLAIDSLTKLARERNVSIT